MAADQQAFASKAVGLNSVHYNMQDMVMACRNIILDTEGGINGKL